MSSLTIAHVVVSVLLSIAILLQNRGTNALSSGGSANYYTRRGMEQFLFRATVFVAFFFLLIGIVNIAVLAR